MKKILLSLALFSSFVFAGTADQWRATGIPAANGGTNINPTTNASGIDIIFGASALGNKALVIQGKSGQTANLVEIQSSTGSLITAIGAELNKNFLQMSQGSSAALSDANTGRIIYNASTQTWQASANGGAYATLATGSGGVSTSTLPLIVTGSNIALGTATGPTTVDAASSATWSPSGAASKALVVQGKAAQSANLFEAQSSTGTAMMSVASDGSVISNTITALTHAAGLTLNGKDSPTATQNGGAIQLNGGSGNTTGTGGAVSILAGTSGAGATGDGGGVNVTAGNALSTAGIGGDVIVTAGNGSGTGTGGQLDLFAGQGGVGLNTGGGAVVINGGNGAGTGNSFGGSVSIYGGTGNTDGTGGSIAISGGTGVGSGNGGTVLVDAGSGAAGGAVNIGTAQAQSINIGRATKAISVAGPTTFTPTGTLSGVNVGSFAGDPSGLNNGDMWYNSSTGFLKIRSNGITTPLNPMTASGDIIYGGTSGVATKLAKGTDGQVLTLASGLPSWATVASGTDYSAVRAATTTNVNLGATLNGVSVDGITLAVNDRVLIKNQNTTAPVGFSTDGIYVVNAGVPTRATDLDATAEFIYGKTVIVQEGDVNRGAVFAAAGSVAASAFVLGTSTQAWQRMQQSFDLSFTVPSVMYGTQVLNSTGSKSVRSIVYGTNIAQNMTSVTNLCAMGNDILANKTAAGPTSTIGMGFGIFSGASYTGQFNTGIGFTIAPALTTGNHNVMIGNTIGSDTTTTSNSTLIGSFNSGDSGSSVGIGTLITIGTGKTSTIAIGNGVDNSGGGINNILLGAVVAASGSKTQSVTIGPAGANAYASNTMTLGGSSGPITTLIGSKGGDAVSTPGTFTVKTGDAAGTNIAGGDIVLAPGYGTGMGSSATASNNGAVRLQTSTVQVTSTTVQNAYVDRVIVCKPLNLTDNTTTTIMTLPFATLDSAGGTIRYTVVSHDGTDVQSNSGILYYNATNKAGTVVCNLSKTEDSNTTGASTLSTTFSSTAAANLLNIRINADTSFGTPTILRLLYTIENNSQLGVTLP